MTQTVSDNDPFDLNRFVDAQKSVYETALSELRRGRKTSHWMWFIFPQVAGLGQSAMSQRYAIADLEEATAYLAHPVLGARLRACAEVVLTVEGRSASAIFGSPDDMKLQSSMTLFARADGNGSVFGKVLEKYYGRETDEKTIALLHLSS